MRQNFPPFIADLKQDIAGNIPVELIKEWLSSKRDSRTHSKLIKPYKRHGITVSSDSAGLSKLSTSRNLIEVMALINKPKEIIFKYGNSLGGNPVGVWAADNTQMFYDESVDADSVLEHMIMAQHEINEFSEIKVGLCLHHGTFFNLGEGLFGKAADTVEEVAEDHTSGGEIKISRIVREQLSQDIKSLMKMTGGEVKNMYTVAYSGFKKDLKIKSSEETYPLPFSKEFLELLRLLENQKIENLNHKTSKFLFTKYVILLKVDHDPDSLLLDDLSDWVLANSVIDKSKSRYDIQTIKSNGSLGIFVSDNFKESINFARDVQEKLSELEYDSRICITFGETLLFDLENGMKEIAGSTINLASKIAEDAGEKGKIYIEESCIKNESKLSVKFSDNFEVEVSGVKICGKVL